jgi:hypothetical protein
VDVPYVACVLGKGLDWWCSACALPGQAPEWMNGSEVDQKISLLAPFWSYTSQDYCGIHISSRMRAVFEVASLIWSVDQAQGCDTNLHIQRRAHAQTLAASRRKWRATWIIAACMQCTERDRSIQRIGLDSIGNACMQQERWWNLSLACLSCRLGRRPAMLSMFSSANPIRDVISSSITYLRWHGACFKWLYMLL